MSTEQRGRDTTETIDTMPEAETTASYSSNVPELSKGERREVARRTRLSAIVVHETVREEGERELQRHPGALAWSALAAGLSMGFSLVAQGLLHTYLRGTSWSPIIDNFGYSLGFVIVVLGRQQLFTENTLTVILPMLARPSLRTFWRIVRLWSIVLVCNLIGALVFATIVARTSIFPLDVQRSFAEI